MPRQCHDGEPSASLVQRPWLLHHGVSLAESNLQELRISPVLLWLTPRRQIHPAPSVRARTPRRSATVAAARGPSSLSNTQSVRAAHQSSDPPRRPSSAFIGPSGRSPASPRYRHDVQPPTAGSSVRQQRVARTYYRPGVTALQPIGFPGPTPPICQAPFGPTTNDDVDLTHW